MRPALLRLLPVAALVLPVLLLGAGRAEARRPDAQVRTAVHSTSTNARHTTTHRAARHTSRVAQAHRRAATPAS